MSQQDESSQEVKVKNGKVKNDDSVSKRSIAAMFQSEGDANTAVVKLKEAGFGDSEIEQDSAKEGQSVMVHAGARAIIALEILVNAGGDTNSNRPEQAPEQVIEQAEDVRTLPREDNNANVVLSPSSHSNKP